MVQHLPMRQQPHPQAPAETAADQTKGGAPTKPEPVTRGLIVLQHIVKTYVMGEQQVHALRGVSLSVGAVSALSTTPVR